MAVRKHLALLRANNHFLNVGDGFLMNPKCIYDHSVQVPRKHPRNQGAGISPVSDSLLDSSLSFGGSSSCSDNSGASP